MSQKIDANFSSAAENAADKATDKLGVEEQRLTTPTWESIRQMLPDPQDQAELEELMAAVNQDTAHNEKVAAVLRNINSFAGIVVKIMERFK